MKILHVISTLDPKDGGPPIVCGAIASSQARAGHEVTVMTYRDPGSEGFLKKVYGAMPGWEKVKLVQGPAPTRLEWYTGFGAGKVLKGLVPGHDFVHVHSVWEPILVRAASIARANGVKYCVLLNGMLDPWALQQSKWKKKISMVLAHRRMLRGAAFLHTLNEDEEVLLGPLDLGVKLERIPNGVFLNDIDPLPERGFLRSKFPNIGPGPVVLFLSRLHYKKGLDLLAGAFKRVAAERGDVELVVAGPDGGEKAPFEARIREAGLEKRVHVVGPLYGRDKYAAMVDAATFCLPSRQEGFSLAITEALACACPVVITENCHFPEVAVERAGEVVKLDEGEVAAGLLRVLSDEQRAREMGKRGRAMVESRYTWPRIGELAVECYRRALGKK